MGEVYCFAIGTLSGDASNAASCQANHMPCKGIKVKILAIVEKEGHCRHINTRS